MSDVTPRFAGVSARLARSLVAVAFAAGLAAAPSPARAQAPEELKAARELFQEAYKDEQEKRFEAALEKFQRVAKVRESASVRYRIASVLESLGRLRDARDAFRALAASKPTLPPNEQEIATSSEERAQSLDKRIPTLTLQTDGKPPPEAKIAIDGTPVAPSMLGTPIPLEPGEHVVSATGTGAAPFESRVKLAEGGGVALTVPVVVRSVPPGGAPASGNEGSTPGASSKTLGVVALAAGGVLLVGAGVILAVREGDISDLEAACPGGKCPRSQQSELESTRDQAKLFGPLGITMGIVGLGVAGLGGYLLLRGEPERGGAPRAALAPGLRVRFAATPISGGGAALAAGTF